jgi:Tfp pilus assembly protein PilV
MKTTLQIQPVGPRPGQHGIGLIELLATLVMLAVGILAVAQLFQAGARGQQKDRMLSVASMHAQEKVEALGALDWSHADLTPGTHGPESVGTSGVYVITYVVTVLPAPMELVKRVDLTVAYRYLGSRTETATVYVRK